MEVDNNRNSLPSAGPGTDGEGASSPGPPTETLREEFPLDSPLLLDPGAADSQRQEEEADTDGDIEVKGEVKEDWAHQVEEEEKDSLKKEEKSEEEEELGSSLSNGC